MKVKIKNLRDIPVALGEGKVINPGQTKTVEMTERTRYLINNKVIENLGEVQEKKEAFEVPPVGATSDNWPEKAIKKSGKKSRKRKYKKTKEVEEYGL